MYEGEIIKVLEQSDDPVPADVHKLWNEYVARAAEEGQKVKAYSGFHGKGYKFDETEEQLAAERKKAQRTALGLQDSDEEEGGVDIDQQVENTFCKCKACGR